MSGTILRAPRPYINTTTNLVTPKVEPPSSSSHTPHPARTVTMVGYLRCFLSIYAVVLAACMPQLVTSQQHDDQFSLRRLDVMIGNSDEYNQLRNHDPFVRSLCGIPFLPRTTIPQTLEPTSEPRSQIDDGTFTRINQIRDSR